MAVQVEQHIYQFKRGTAQRWIDVNPILRQGEPGFEYDTGKFKIGDGFTPWLGLSYINGGAIDGGADELFSVPSYSDLPKFGKSEMLYRVIEEKMLYQWNPIISEYEILGTIPEVDNKSISNNNKVLELYNFSQALSNQIPHKGENGKLVWKNICLRRDNDYNYKAHNSIPDFGEILLVDTAREGLRIKCGDGITPYNELSFTDEFYLKGYYKENKFYTDKTYSIELNENTNKLYIDLSSNVIYFYDGQKFISTVENGSLPNASATSAGILKLYDTVGNNTDGTMTQAAITDELDDKVEVDVNLDEELLIFTN